MVDKKDEKKEPQIKASVVTIKKDKQDLRKKEKPLVDIKVTNPITYIKSWWKKIIGNEGIEMKVKVRPLTAIAIAIIVVTVSFGVGKVVFPFKIPFFVYTTDDEEKPQPSPNPYREAAFSGTLKYLSQSGRYYLLTGSSEAIYLEVPDNINLSNYIGQRIVARGNYATKLKTLVVEETADMEVLPTKAEVIPTNKPEPTSTPIPTVTPQVTLEPTFEVQL
ncbi:MAG: hypothetical protein ACW99F_16480 [Candidatus Hodarchaeales archaeon]|jgi:hypothetical protein